MFQLLPLEIHYSFIDLTDSSRINEYYGEQKTVVASNITKSVTFTDMSVTVCDI